MFVLVVHTITDVTAKVPFAMMVLQDALKTKAIPSHLKVMQLLPTSGARSSSLWEGPTVEQVETFVNELLAEWCLNECFAVVDEHAYALRPQEALATSTREGVGKMVATTVAATTGAAAVVSAQLSSVDERFQVKEKAAKGWSAVVEASGIAGSQVAHQSAQLSGRAMENQTVAAGVTSLSNAFGFLKTKATEVAAKVGDQVTTINEQVVSKVQEYQQRKDTNATAAPAAAEPAANTA